MSYVLGISFEYHRYHRGARMRIFADDHLVEEIRLKKDIKLRCFNWQNLPFPLSNPTDINEDVGAFSRVRIMPEKLFLFEINEEFLQKSIRVEVVNDHNNHTNGFMTNYSYITYHEMFLMPASLLDFNAWKTMILKRRDPFQLDDIKRPTFFPKIFPSFEVTLRDSTNEWRGHDGAQPNNVSGNLQYHPRGGSFTIEFVLHKRYGLIHVGKFKASKNLWINPEPAKILYSFRALNNSV